VTQTQATLIQIDTYGPRTVTPEPRREVDLQTIQDRRRSVTGDTSAGTAATHALEVCRADGSDVEFADRTEHAERVEGVDD